MLEETSSSIPEIKPKRKLGRPKKEKPIVNNNEEILTTVDNTSKEITVAELFTNTAEKKSANEILKKYLQDFIPETISDRNNLKSLVYLEIVQIRLQNLMNELSQDSNAVPLQMIDAVHKNLREICSFKEKLGLGRNSEDETRMNDSFKALELLKVKFKKWREQNQASRTLCCPHCGKMTLLKIRTDKWEAGKHPFFQDRTLGNKHLISLLQQGKITKDDVAAILDVSSDYNEWLIDKWNLNKKEENNESKENGSVEGEVNSGTENGTLETTNPEPTTVQDAKRNGDDESQVQV